MLTVSVNIDGLVRKFQTVANTANDLTPALRRMGGYMKKVALAKYEQQAFAPLAASTIEKRALHGLHSLEKKLERDYRKAKRRAWDGARASGNAPRGLIARALSRMTLSDMVGEHQVAQTRGVQNRLAVLEEFRRFNFKGAGGRGITAKQQVSLTNREQRAIAKAVGGPILGGLPRTLGVRVDRGNVTLKSQTYQHFSDAHNKGEVVGHGAKEPQRETVSVDETDFRIFRGILIEELLMPFETSK